MRILTGLNPNGTVSVHLAAWYEYSAEGHMRHMVSLMLLHGVAVSDPSMHRLQGTHVNDPEGWMMYAPCTLSRSYVHPARHTGCAVHTPDILFRKKKSSHSQSEHRLNLYFSVSTKWAFSIAAHCDELPSEDRVHAGAHAGSDVPHMYIPVFTVLGSQQKSFRLWKTVRAWVVE
jgi:hypothetical protein